MFKYIPFFFFHFFEPITTILFPTTNQISQSSRKSQRVSMEMIAKELRKADKGKSSLLVYGYWRSAQEDGKLFLPKDIQKIISAYYEEYHPSEHAVLLWYNTLIAYEVPHLLPLLKFIVTHDLVEKDLDEVLLEAVKDNKTEIVKMFEEFVFSNKEHLENAVSFAKKNNNTIIEKILLKQIEIETIPQRDKNLSYHSYH